MMWVVRFFQRVPENRLRVAAVAITLTSLALALATMLLGERSEHAGFLPVSFYVANAQRPILLATTSVLAILGGLLTWRLPRLTYGWLWVWLAMTLIFIEFGRWYAAYDLFLAGRTLPLMRFIAWLTISAWSASLAITAFVLLFFPAGALPSPRWRPFALVILALAFLTFLSAAFLPGLMLVVPYSNPYSWLTASWVAPVRRVGNTATTALLLCILVSGASVFLRLRRAQGVERQQVKWFAFASLVVVAFFALDLMPATILPMSQYRRDVLGAIAFLLLALAMVVALLRYRLYDIDLIIRRTLAYAVVTALLAILYLGIVIVAQGMLIQLTGQTSQAALVLSTLAIAALFNPLRLRVQRTIDGRYFRRKYDVDVVLQGFMAMTRDETDIEQVTRELATVVRETLQPTEVRVWLLAGQPSEMGARGES